MKNAAVAKMPVVNINVARKTLTHWQHKSPLSLLPNKAGVNALKDFQADSSQCSILVVDDEPLIRESLSDLLESEGFDCQTASTGFEAVEKLRLRPCALVIADIGMPVFNGLQLLQTITESHPDVAVMIITGIVDIETAVQSMQQGACDYITKPVNAERVLSSVGRALNLRQQRLQSAENREGFVCKKTVALRSVLKDLREHQHMILEALLRALDARGHETHSHSLRVQDYAVRLAEQFGFRNGKMDGVANGALLHDIGKIGISDAILLKPGKLSPEETLEIKKHPTIGNQIVRDIKFLERAAPIILYHHERFDGSGYPARLRGEQIPLEARIFSVMDTYDAIGSNRPYREKLTPEFARQEIMRNASTQFDPFVVKEFLKIPQRDWDQISLKYS